jgi:hypothetical protein
MKIVALDKTYVEYFHTVCVEEILEHETQQEVVADLADEHEKPGVAQETPNEAQG